MKVLAVFLFIAIASTHAGVIGEVAATVASPIVAIGSFLYNNVILLIESIPILGPIFAVLVDLVVDIVSGLASVIFQLFAWLL